MVSRQLVVLETASLLERLKQPDELVQLEQPGRMEQPDELGLEQPGMMEQPDELAQRARLGRLLGELVQLVKMWQALELPLAPLEKMGVRMRTKQGLKVLEKPKRLPVRLGRRRRLNRAPQEGKTE
jgi:hypothetical protein